MMGIAWRNWILNWLPPACRHTGVFAFARVMVCGVMVLYDEYRVFERDARLRVSVTPQREVLEEMIGLRMGINVVLEEGDGRPVDFIVKCDSQDVDRERFLFSFLDKYKQAGKTYAYENVSIVSDATWTGFVCEMADLGHSWTGYVCERMVVTGVWTGYVCERGDKAMNTICVTGTGMRNERKIVATYAVVEPLVIEFKTTESPVYIPYLLTGTGGFVTLSEGVEFVSNSFRLTKMEDDLYRYELIEVL